MLEIFKALGDENRLRLLNLLCQRELCVCELEVMLDLSQSNVSRHLGKLKNAGIIESTKDAQWIHYKVSESFITLNKGLYSDLLNHFGDEVHFQMDNGKLNEYLSNNLNCTMIKENRDSVITVIGGGMK